jgi:GNAT acetyltransferase-like protein
LQLKIGYTTLFEPSVKRLFFLQGGFLGNFSDENMQALFRELKNCLERKEADHAELARIIPNSVQQQVIEKEFSLLCTGQFSTLHEHRWVELPSTFEQFVQSMSRKNRHELRRHEKRLAADFAGKARFRCYRHEDEVAELAREVEKISAKTYQRALGVGFLPSIEVLDYLRTMAHKTGLRGCLLYLDEQPCAFFIGVQYRDTFHGNFMGFDPQYSRYSPGLLVLMHNIEHCFEPDCRASQIDFGWGDRRYKRVICNQSRQDGPMYLYPFSATGLKLNFLRSATSFLDLAARKFLARYPSLQKLKRLWQGRLQNSGAPSPPDGEYAD